MSITALYRPYSAAGRLLYVGIASDPEKRMDGHQCDHWYADIAAMDITLYPDRRQAKTAESEAIKTEWPLWNIAESPWGDVAASYAWRLWRLRELRHEELSVLTRPLVWTEDDEIRFAEEMRHHFHVRRLTERALSKAERRQYAVA